MPAATARRLDKFFGKEVAPMDIQFIADISVEIHISASLLVVTAIGILPRIVRRKRKRKR